MPNIKFSYLYRDAANYKNHGSIIFANPEDLSLTEILATITTHLIDGEYFHHQTFNVPPLFFPNHNPELDHDLHEFAGITITDERVNHSIAIFKTYQTP
jgi:hypothetical protein